MKNSIVVVAFLAESYKIFGSLRNNVGMDFQIQISEIGFESHIPFSFR